MGYGEVKTRLLQLVDEYFAPYRERRRELAASPDYVMDVLREGALAPGPWPRRSCTRSERPPGSATTY